MARINLDVEVSHLVTYLVWPRQPENPPGRPVVHDEVHPFPLIPLAISVPTELICQNHPATGYNLYCS